jgi:hypothetical protein
VSWHTVKPASQPPRETPNQTHRRTALLAQPFGEGPRFRNRLTGGLDRAQNIRAKEIAPRAKLAGTALKVKGRNQRGGVEPVRLNCRGHERKADAMINASFQPCSRSTVGRSCHFSPQRYNRPCTVLFSAKGPGFGDSKWKPNRPAELNLRRFNFRRNKIRAVDQLLRLSQARVSPSG